MLTLAEAMERQRKGEALIAEDQPVRIRFVVSAADRTVTGAPGDILDLPLRDARRLIAAGIAVEAAGEELSRHPNTCPNCGILVEFRVELDRWLCAGCSQVWR